MFLGKQQSVPATLRSELSKWGGFPTWGFFYDGSNLPVVLLEEISLKKAQNTFDYDALTPEVRIVVRQFQQAH